METAELRRRYLQYFRDHDHLLVPSSSLVPYRDPSVLLTTAGMQQFKPYYLGMEQPPHPRLASCQKCFRTTDIDRVGLTARHLTFFEMLGNFSIGDYFKKEAIRFAWELSTEGFELPPEHLWVTVFEGDDEVPPDEEAMEHWEAVGIPRERMVGLPRSDNFWGPAGLTGPCGPCSELYYDWGPGHGCGRPDCKPGCECDRYMEYWNLVFTQYNMDESRRLSPLPANNIDTGMGLERIASIKQGVESVFLTDLFRPLIDLGEELSGHRLGDDPQVDIALRVMADHSRAMAFLVADGVLPSNEGRGYVLRRVIRRAARFSRNAQMQPPFLARFAERVIELLGSAYPELVERSDSILRIVSSEEDRFNRTLDQGLVLLEEQVEHALEKGETSLPGSVAFVLHDTYGFPVEVTREIAEERGLALDTAGFDAAMDEQRRRARLSQRGAPERERDLVTSFARDAHPTEFQGYEREELFTVLDKLEPLDEERVLLSLRESPFYAEGGGQVADQGWIEGDAGRAEVLDVQQQGAVQVIIARLDEGILEAGTRVKAVVRSTQRHWVAANHTGTHLLHYALRTTVGKDVLQSGSSVRADKFRFDFAYHQPLGAARLREIEEVVNRKIVENHPVRAFLTTLEHARDLGAMALFGEKYGEFVRLVEIDDFSRELCGGTHVHWTSEIGAFKILSEGSVGANVRRIEAVTGAKAVEYFRERDELVQQAAGSLGTKEEGLLGAIEKLKEAVRDLEAEAKELRSGKSQDLVKGIVDTATESGGVRLAVAEVEARDMEHLLVLADQVRDRLSPAVVALGAVVQGKSALVVSVSGHNRAHAGELVRQAAVVAGGGGGGSPTLGRGGGGDPTLLSAALERIRQLVIAALEA